ncbi:YneF family protein [Ureaplasma ceti]|uniref:YneF family protein n=1 Tax=Ureaplasma ceti TaxID=3119530 RepID=A0ABP9U4W6_9BACT
MSAGAIAGLAVGVCILGLIIGLIAGYFISRKVFQSQLKKNPPITKDTIRMIYSQVGRKPTEQQVNDIYRRATKVK